MVARSTEGLAGGVAGNVRGRLAAPPPLGWRAVDPSRRPPPLPRRSVLASVGGDDRTASDGGDDIELRVRLVDYAAAVERAVSLVPGRGDVIVAERVTNESNRPVDYMWVHHPAFGAPLVAPGARIRTSASTILADAGTRRARQSARARNQPWLAGRADARRSRARPVAHPGRFAQPVAARIPVGFDEGKASIENDALGLACTLSWQLDVFPYAWLWQELGATAGPPGSVALTRWRSSRRRATQAQGWATSSRRALRTARSRPETPLRRASAFVSPRSLVRSVARVDIGVALPNGDSGTDCDIKNW